MIWSGGMALDRRFPRSVQLLRPILGCGGAVQGGWNWAWYCNEELDAQAAEADAMVDPAKKAEREKMWGEIYVKVMEDAPWVPVFNEQRFTMHSPRMGGDAALCRSRPHPDQLRLRVRDRCAIAGNTIHGRHHHFGGTTIRPPARWRPGRRSSSNASMPPAAN